MISSDSTPDNDPLQLRSTPLGQAAFESGPVSARAVSSPEGDDAATDGPLQSCDGEAPAHLADKISKYAWAQRAARLRERVKDEATRRVHRRRAAEIVALYLMEGLSNG